MGRRKKKKFIIISEQKGKHFHLHTKMFALPKNSLFFFHRARKLFSFILFNSVCFMAYVKRKKKGAKTKEVEGIVFLKKREMQKGEGKNP